VISPWAKRNAVDHTLTDQSSIIAFVEDNWNLPRIYGSYDAVAGSLNGLFDFAQPNRAAPNSAPFQLDPMTGQPVH
jgi:phospholipase C